MSVFRALKPNSPFLVLVSSYVQKDQKVPDASEEEGEISEDVDKIQVTDIFTSGLSLVMCNKRVNYLRILSTFPVIAVCLKVTWTKLQSYWIFTKMFLFKQQILFRLSKLVWYLEF